VDILDNQFDADTESGWGIFVYEAAIHASGNTFGAESAGFGKWSPDSWLHGGAIAGANARIDKAPRSVIENNTFYVEDASAIDGLYCDFDVLNNKIYKYPGANNHYALWMHMDGMPEQNADTEWKVQGNTVTLSGTPGAEVGIYATGRGSHLSRLSLDKTGADEKNEISGFGIGVEVGVKGSATIKNSVITGNGEGVRVDAGTALVQGNELQDNTSVGLHILNGGIVDAGQTAADGDEDPGNYTGLGTSSGGNYFTSYTSQTVPAIKNDNSSGTVEAEGNVFQQSDLGFVAGVVVGSVDYTNPMQTLAAAGGVKLTGAVTTPLRLSQLQPIVAAAIARWSHAGASTEMLKRMSQAEFVIVDLSGPYLGMTQQTTVYLDATAAGFGWFIDQTPSRDEEFRPMPGRSQMRAVDPRALNRMDLLTAVEHELGHIAGLNDLWSGGGEVMMGTLDSGLRRVPERSDLPLVRPVPPKSKSSASSGSRFAASEAVDQIWAMYAAEWGAQDAKRRSQGLAILSFWHL